MRVLKPLSELISLKGKKALITGPALGIGRAMASRFAEAGADLELVDINERGQRPWLRKSPSSGWACLRLGYCSVPGCPSEGVGNRMK